MAASISALAPPLFPLCFSSSSSSSPPHLCGPSSPSSSSKLSKPLIPHSITLMAGSAVVALATSALVAPAALAALEEPANALSLPTWAIHVSSVVEWVTAMVLVWEYGEKSGFDAWKGLSWGMVPLLGGALCACTWHFFYNSESLEVDAPFANVKSFQEQCNGRMQRRKRGRKKKLGGEVEAVGGEKTELVNILKLYWENRNMMEENERLKEKALVLYQQNEELRSHLLTIRSVNAS